MHNETKGIISRRAFVAGAILAAALPVPVGAEATPTASDWQLPQGATYEALLQGTVEELTTLSALVSVSRVEVSPFSGVFSFYNDDAGMIGPRIVYVEDGSLEVGPINVSPGSLAGPTMLVRKGDTPKVVLPETTQILKAGDYMVFPADTALYVSSDDSSDSEMTTYLEADVFPTYTVGSGTVVEGMEAQQLAIDVGIETADMPAPDVIRPGRLTIAAGMETTLPRNLSLMCFIETGGITANHDETTLQVNKGSASNPGEILPPGEAILLSPGDSFFVAAGDALSLRSDGEQVSLLVVSIG